MGELVCPGSNGLFVGFIVGPYVGERDGSDEG